MIACSGDAEFSATPSSGLGSIGGGRRLVRLQIEQEQVASSGRLYRQIKQQGDARPFLPEDPDYVAAVNALQREDPRHPSAPWCSKPGPLG